MGRKAAPAIFAAKLKMWGRYAPHRDTRPLLQGPIGQLVVFEEALALFQVVFLQRRVQPACIQPRQHIPTQGRQQLVDVRNGFTPQLAV